ncbi:Mitochondrial GTPase [Monosporozyma unispora]|nr:Mitochondrial GTPase [Kazachstania unispora]
MLKSDFKGHQMKALRKIESLGPQLNMLLELRDIRAPLSTKNIIFDKLLQDWKYNDLKRLIIYTKKDLFPNQQNVLSKLTQWHNELNEDFMLIDARNKKEVRNLFKIIEYNGNEMMNQMGMPLPMGYRVLITGIPNLGKSTLINSLRSFSQGKDDVMGKKKKVARTGNEAGVTRSTSECIRITSNTNNETKQPIYLIDTPGIGLPGRVSNEIRMLSQSLCGSLKSNLIDPIIVADYLLYLMNLQQSDKKVEWYPNCISNPTNNVYDVLERIRTNKAQDENSLAIKWVTHWTRFGKNLLFDIEMLLSNEEFSYKKYVNQELKKLGDLSITARFNDKTRSIGKLFS